MKCCTASATLTAVELIMSMNNVPVNFSRLFLYYMTRQMQNRIGQKGAELGATLESLKIYGCCTDKLWPFIVSRTDKSPNHLCIEEALNYRLDNYESIPMTNFNYYLERNIPVIIGMRIGRKFLKLQGPISEQQYYPVNTTDNRPSFGHAVTIVGFDDTLNGGSWIAANSMGLRWGDKGYCAIPYSCEIDIGEAYAIHSFAGFTAEKKILDN